MLESKHLKDRCHLVTRAFGLMVSRNLLNLYTKLAVPFLSFARIPESQ